jgi:hypothetical protein
MSDIAANGDVDPRVVRAVLAEVLPRIVSATQSSIEAALARQRGWDVVPATIVGVNGPDAFVIPDDQLGETGIGDDEEVEANDIIQATRLDDWQGVAGGVLGSRARTLLLRIPPHGGYCFGLIPDPRPDETLVGEDVHGGYFESDTDGNAHAAGALTDMAVQGDLTAGYIYEFAVNSRWTYGTASASYGIMLDRAGSVYRQLGRFPPAMTSGGAGTLMHLSAATRFIATEDEESVTFTVANSSTSGGTIQMLAGAGFTRDAILTCKGPARGFAIG